MNAAFGVYGQLGGPSLGAYGKASAQERCAGAWAAKRAGKGSYRLRNVDVMIAQWCEGAEAEVEALEMAKLAAGMDPKTRKAEARASQSGVDPVLLFGGLAAVGLVLAAVIVMRKPVSQAAP